MKKKLLVFMLLLVTVIVLAVPTPALAWGGRTTTQTAFVAVAKAYVSNPGTITDFHQVSRSVWVQSTDGEEVQGQIITSPRWPAVNGAGFQIAHHSTTYLNFATMKITGTAEGTITVAKPDGTVYLTGSYKAFIRGSFSVDANGVPNIYDRIYDAATWTLSGTAGGASVSASGIAFANLSWTEVLPGNYTLAGPMILTGTYK